MDKEDLSIARPSFNLTQKITDFFSIFLLTMIYKRRYG